jgi:hypothetical protein
LFVHHDVLFQLAYKFIRSLYLFTEDGFAVLFGDLANTGRLFGLPSLPRCPGNLLLRYDIA